MSIVEQGAVARDELHGLIEPMVRDRLAPFGYSDLEAWPEEDFDGWEIIRVVARVERRAPHLAVRLVDEIRQMLATHGDTRFVFLDFSSPDEDGPEEDE